ncbi:MAG: hypothetical protein ABI600_04000 [Luteolibacter sp.]
MKTQNPVLANTAAFNGFSPKNGFALIVTLSLMILLTVIAVGLLSLSSISLRASSSGAALEEARQNARFAMMLALGQLQAQTGQDTRVTASSNVVNPTGVPLTGAWRSWEGVDRDATGLPIAPDYNVKKSAADRTKPFDSSASAGRFVGWLTSTAEGIGANASQLPDVASTANGTFIQMVGPSSVIDATRQVYMKPTLIDGGKGVRGGMAWWTSGDNSKARINVGRTAPPTTPVGWQQLARSNGSADAEFFGLKKISAFTAGTVIPSTGNLKLVDPSKDLRKIHDLTAFSRGLLTNTATGGWRKDLSLVSGNYSALPETGLPFLTVKPGQIQTSSKASSSSYRTNGLLYPWANYRAGTNDAAWAQTPPICSWDALVDYMLQYNNLNSSSAAKTAMTAYSWGHGQSSDRVAYQEKVRRAPQIARIHWIYSLCSKLATDPAHAGKLRPALMITPAVTLWNPYNVEITVSSFAINFQNTAPLSFQFKVGSTVYPKTTINQIAKITGGYTPFRLNINSTITLAPGASRIFGLNSITPKDGVAADNILLTPGYSPNGGYLFYGLNAGNEVYADAGDAFAIQEITYDAETYDGGAAGLGIYFDVMVDGSMKGAHRMIFKKDKLGGDAVVNQLYPPLTNKLSTTVGEVENLKSRPFASAIFGYRMASPMANDSLHKHLFTKGMLQANPLCYYAEVGAGEVADADTSMAGSGTNHPANAPYDFAFQDVQGWNDNSNIPQFEASTNSSYIVSGLTPSDGLTRCVMAELPTRPLQSIADLQHFDARNNNPVPPFQFNLIGNGSAQPVFAPDAVKVATSYNNGMVNDDSYMLNNMLFDDWFVSSIATELQDYKTAQSRSINNVYQDHLSFAKPLPNRNYIPAPGADQPSVAEAVTSAMDTAKNATTGTYQFETIASKLEVDGMFNINSVSLDAWKAILRQGRNAEIPYLNASGATVAGAAASFPFPRTSIAGDMGSDSNSKFSGATFGAAAEFAGSRVLTDPQIDALAQEIVSEIQKRGPFLSLSEFVNRRLSTDKDLAIAGTIQKALDNLSNMGASPKNPFQVLEENSVHITSAPPGNTDYKFPEAALGWSAFGVPGWVRQADILRPIAPVISARDDTFTIRAYGDSRDQSNSTKINARAWCEVVVKRSANFVDPVDSPGVTPFSTQMKSSANKTFGRRYEIVSFRWLNAKEI